MKRPRVARRAGGAGSAGGGGAARPRAGPGRAEEAAEDHPGAGRRAAAQALLRPPAGQGPLAPAPAPAPTLAQPALSSPPPARPTQRPAAVLPRPVRTARWTGRWTGGGRAGGGGRALGIGILPPRLPPLCRLPARGAGPPSSEGLPRARLARRADPCVGSAAAFFLWGRGCESALRDLRRGA